MCDARYTNAAELGTADRSSAALGTAPLAALMAEVAAGAGKTLAASETLPPAAYTSQAFYDLEVEKIFRKDWLAIAHISQIPNPGDYIPIDLCGELLMAVHGRDGVIRTMSRVCLHRWAPLVNEAGNTRTFMCPFHAWGYALDGKLIGAPLMEKVEGFTPKDCSLPTYRTEVVDGFVYMNFDDAAPPLAPQIADMVAHMGGCRAADLKVAGKLTYDCKFNWKIVVETFMECYHHLAAHPVTFEKDFPARLSWGEDARPAWTVVHSPARPGVAPKIFDEGLPFIQALNELQLTAFSLYQVFPYQIFATNPDRIGWFRLQPKGPHETRLELVNLFLPEAFEQPDMGEILETRKPRVEQIMQEDIAVNVMQQLGAAAPSSRAGRLSHLESAVWQLADYVRARVAA